MTPLRESAKARPHRSMLEGFCNAGFLRTVIMMARLVRKAKIANDPLTITRRMWLMWKAVLFSTIPVQLGSPQTVVCSLTVISPVLLFGWP